MAINPSTLNDYNGQIANPTPEYPYGSARDDVAPGDLTGTPRVSPELNDTFGFHQELLTSSGLVPTGAPDEVGASQYADALRRLTVLPWSNTVTYPVFARVRGSDGVIYRSGVVHVGNDPVTTPGIWVRDDNTVLSYSDMRVLPPGALIDGQTMTLTAAGKAGPGTIRNIPGHAITDDRGVNIVIDANWVWQRDVLGGVVQLDWWEDVTADGVTDDFAAIGFATQYMESINDKTSIISATLNLGQARQYAVSGRVYFRDYSVNGNGSVFVPLAVAAGVRIAGTRMIHQNYKVIWPTQQTNSSARSFIFGDEVADVSPNQTSKNNFIQLNSRNAYRGFTADSTSNPFFGNEWNNCRSDNNFDWQWYLDLPTGSTTNNFTNCHARGQIIPVTSPTPKGMFLSNSNEFNLRGCAIDGSWCSAATGGRALWITNTQSTTIDNIALESCQIDSSIDPANDVAAMVEISSNTATVGVVMLKACTVNNDIGQMSFMVKFTGGTLEATLGFVTELFEAGARNGDFFKLSNSSATITQCAAVDLQDVFTNGNERNIYNLGDTQGYVLNDAFLPAAGVVRREFVNQTPVPGEFTRFVDDGSDHHIVGVIQGGVTVSATTVEFADVTNPVNTLGKWTGKVIPDTTTGLQMQSTGSAAASPWQPSDGSATITPV